jgi:asparagine synthase (glutamine-hydrolysing)
MCGFSGYLDMRHERAAEREVLVRMTERLAHRGPDSSGYLVEGPLGFGFRRLSIIDLETGDQPITNEDGSVVLMCNGEIFNYRELREGLVRKGHSFRTNTDVEVLVHLYEEEGTEFLNRLNGQFAFVIWDRNLRRLFLARDHFGICPLFYTVADGVFIFASEAKALLAHPLVRPEVDLTGLDQTLSFPGLVSPRTMFKGVESLKSGHHLTVEGGALRSTEYWDLDFPLEADAPPEREESHYVERLGHLLAESVRLRLQADVPVGFFLSGGLDSSLIAALIRRVSPEVRRHSFSVSFADREIDEAAYQRLMARHVESEHHEIAFDWPDIAAGLRRAVYHAECPLKETYNTASLLLSRRAKASGVSVVLNGEGADELFAGYVGYRFDQFRAQGGRRPGGLDAALEDELRERLWGDPDFTYEKDQHAFRELKSALYSEAVAELFEGFDCLNFEVVNKERLRGRSFLNRRSYLDFKLRLGGHLIADHGDRMTMANSVEGRYPFLDRGVVDFVRELPARLKLDGFTEKYILKRVAEGLLPREVVRREKFAFVAPGSTALLRRDVEWVNDLLSYDYVRRRGYFNPEAVESLKAQYSRDGFRLNVPLEDDLLIVVLTFHIFLEAFGLPSLN